MVVTRGVGDIRRHAWLKASIDAEQGPEFTGRLVR
jgi:hypothetical protein